MTSRLSYWTRVLSAVVLFAFALPMLAACGNVSSKGTGVKRGAFTSSEYGVAVSPRVSRSAHPPRGGGRYQVGKPYTVRGKVYTPREQPDYAEVGTASWYGADFHGRRTANGEIFSANAISGAHPTLPLPSYVRVTNLENGRSLLVRVNDRGPYLHGRIVDVSQRAADLLGFTHRGMANVQVDYVSPAPLNGDDTRFLLASLNRSTRIEQGGSTQFAMAETSSPGLRGTLGDVADEISGLFSYAENQGEAAISGAHEAANAMATRASDLREWVAATDDGARKIKLELGVFSDSEESIAVAEAFAMLGAVAEDPVSVGGREATRLTLTHLKPGVVRRDVLNLAQELGLRDIILY